MASGLIRLPPKVILHRVVVSCYRPIARIQAFSASMMPVIGEHVVGEPEVAPLAGQHASELVSEPLVLAKQVAHFRGPHTNISGWHVRVGANMPVQFGHESLHSYGVVSVSAQRGQATGSCCRQQCGHQTRLAEAHDLIVCLAS